MFGGLLHSNHLRRGVLSRPWPLSKKERGLDAGSHVPPLSLFAFLSAAPVKGYQKQAVSTLPHCISTRQAGPRGSPLIVSPVPRPFTPHSSPRLRGAEFRFGAGKLGASVARAFSAEPRSPTSLRKEREAARSRGSAFCRVLSRRRRLLAAAGAPPDPPTQCTGPQTPAASRARGRRRPVAGSAAGRGPFCKGSQVRGRGRRARLQCGRRFKRRS